MEQKAKNSQSYKVIKSRYITEKTTVLHELKDRNSNLSLSRCKNPKVTFLVERDANKHMITEAVMDIYREKNIKVVKVNTINVKAKPKRFRTRVGYKDAFKKAIVTLMPNDSIETV